MALRSNTVRERIETVKVNVFGEELNLGVRLGVLTKDYIRQVDMIGEGLTPEFIDTEGLSDEQAEERQKEADARMEAKVAEAKAEMDQHLSTVIATWDYINDDTGEPFPITYETFEVHVPGVLSNAIWQAIREAQEVPKASSTGSSRRS
jgi:hypothetical protein